MKLILHGIICEKTKEAKDEVFLSLKWNFNRGPFPPAEWTWGPMSMNDGDARRIAHSEQVVDFFEITTYEWDRKHTDEIGKLTYGVLPGGSISAMGRIEHVFKGSRAQYRIIFSWLPGDSQGTDYELHLGSIKCNDAQEGADEPYLAANGATIWGPASMRTGSTQNINKKIKFGHDETVRIDLWEKDPGVSERIGNPLIVDSINAAPPDESPPLQPHVFRGDRGIIGDATYTLYYGVRKAR